MHEASGGQEIGELIQAWKRDGQSIALVPTMGNLHAGHLALLEAARKLADRTVVSIYVNPTQFGANEDLDSYPRTPDADRESLNRGGCDLLFAPTAKTMYPHGLEDAFMLSAPAGLASILEGEFRPGHFDGVVTVVSRLFNLVAPDFAVFGEKDYQQLLIIRRMVEDMGYDIHIHALATVRDSEGMALSSRNRYLDAQQKSAAQNLNKVLLETAEQLMLKRTDYRQLEKEAQNRLISHQLRADYLSIRRESDLAAAEDGNGDLRVLAAVWCGKTRLIDNVVVNLTCNHSD